MRLAFVPLHLPSMTRILAITVLFPPAFSRADEPFSPSGTVIVISGTTEAFAGNEPVAQIGSGSILRYSTQTGPWLLIPRYGGWVSTENVIPIESALGYFEEVIEASPTAQAFQHRGIVHSHLGDYEAALADFQRAHEMGLEDAALYINRGVAHQQAGYLRAAIEDYTRAIRLDATSARAYDNRSSALAELGEWESALADSNDAIRLDPDYAEAFNNRGVTYRHLGEYERAIEDYNAAIELFDRYAAAYANRGYARKQLGHYELAIADYRRAIELDPESAQAHNDLAWLLATCPDVTVRQATLATEHATRACELTGMANGDYLDTLAAARAAAGEFELAIEVGEKALSMIEDSQRPAVQKRLDRYRSGMAYVEH